MELFFNSIIFVQLFITLTIYVLTSFPSISGGDSGELAAIACSGGIAHPPGYPLWLMLARSTLRITTFCANFVGFGGLDAAYCLNILSALFSTAATGVLLSIVRLFSSCLIDADESKKNIVDIASVFGGILACTLYSFSAGIWEFSNQAEVFALNNLLIALLLRTQFVTLQTALGFRTMSFENENYRNQAENKMIFQTCRLAFVSGLCLTNQHTSVVYVILAALSALYAGRDLLTSRVSLTLKGLACYSVSALLGLSPYVYLPFTATFKPLDSWGDQRTIDGFLTHFLRKEYGTFKLASELGEEQDINEILSRFGVFLKRFGDESLYPLGPCLASFGFFVVVLSFFDLNFYQLLLKKKKVTNEHRIGTNGKKTNSQKKTISTKNKVVNTSASTTRTSYKQVNQTKSGFGMLLLLQVTCYSLLINGLANLSFSPLHLNITSRMWQQSYFVGFIFIGVGASYAIFLFLHLTINLMHPSSTLSSLSSLKFSSSIVATLVLSCALLQISTFWSQNDQHLNDTFITYGRQVVAGLPSDALLLVNDDMNCNLPQYVLRCESIRPDVQLVRLPLITYDWWRPMQLHHYTHFQDQDEIELKTQTETQKEVNIEVIKQQKHKKSKIVKSRNGWQLFGSVNSDYNDNHIKEMKDKGNNLKHEKKISKYKKKLSYSGVVSRNKSLAYPGLKHHPFEKDLGSFSLDEFLDANLKHRSVFVAGEWKPGDDSGNAFTRISCGLVDRVVGRDATRTSTNPPPLDMTAYINEGVSLMPRTIPFRISGVLTNRNGTSLPELVEGSWDYIVALKYYRGVFLATQEIAQRMSSLPAPSALPNHTSPFLDSSDNDTENMAIDIDGDGNRIVLLRTATRAYHLLESSGLCSNDSKSNFYCSAALWRNAGIVQGQLAADLNQVGEILKRKQTSKKRKAQNNVIIEETIKEENQSINLMFKYWCRYIENVSTQEGEELLRGIKAGVNPVNQKLYGHPDWLKQWLLSR